MLDPTSGALKPTPGANSLYFAVDELVHARAKELKSLAPFNVHGESACDIVKRPWGEPSSTPRLLRLKLPEEPDRFFFPSPRSPGRPE